MSWTYVDAADDLTYRQPLPTNTPLTEYDIPHQECELRQAIEEWLCSAFIPFSSRPWLDNLFHHHDVDQAKHVLEEADERLMGVLCSEEHRAALARVISVTPDNAPHKKYLVRQFLLPLLRKALPHALSVSAK
ncbi:hypothetical protein [Aliagarivorans taiwanensis]|uniref:hypothetical protein n=1 Tax=Aliagarivorans taiwanensis TaxID=561966 RepID=UPI0004218D2D|nr:hypothetical protein [Aliagarivorans taiwanensis]